MCQAFATAGNEYKGIEEDAKVTVVIPYDKAAEKAIDLLEDSFASLAEQKKRPERYSSIRWEFRNRFSGNWAEQSTISAIRQLTF